MSKITFQFISSGDGASYEIRAWGNPYDKARLEIRYKAYPLYYQDGTKRFNYTDEDYKKYIEDTAGYLTWNRHGEPLPWEIVREFNEHLTEQDRVARARYPDLDWEPITLARGRYRFDPTDWETVIIEDLPE